MKDWGAHILVTSPGWLKNMVDQKKESANLDLSALRLIVFDEADEIFT